jgi:hypothetical protein
MSGALYLVSFDGLESDMDGARAVGGKLVGRFR